MALQTIRDRCSQEGCWEASGSRGASGKDERGQKGVAKGMTGRDLKTKWILPGNQEEPSHCLFCPHSPFCSFHLQPLFTHFNVSDSGADGCHVTRTSECQKLGNEGSFSAEAEWASPTSATIAVDSIAAALA